ncbi:G-rich sequence factor 1 [Austrofundulus limnaeus]|uniref:G-rich sequence factor 1 n=1 Tax=Austrofundulus limnaeus TaxID=52670 RepID=A0A2I4CQ98_AUSLI|nr:PREDICTED: heterogeneous nuclear ribonucleoprotein F-like [Austrofundulus limnaeus]
MFGTSGSVSFLLRRCVAARRLPLLAAAARSRSGVPSVCWSSTHPRTWTSHTPTDHLRTAWHLQPASRCIQHGFCTNAQSPWEEMYPLPTYQPESGPGNKEVYLVQVKGLPWSTTEQDLVNFFSDCRIRDGEKGVHLTLDYMGRPSGIAFLELEHEEDMIKALDKHRMYLGPRYIQVFEVTEREAEEFMKQSGRSGGEDGVVHLRGLPYSCTEADIRDFFSGLDIKVDGITMTTNSTGRFCGTAYVEFSSQEDADKALLRHRDLMGHRYIQVFPSSKSSIRSSDWDTQYNLSPPRETGYRAGSDPQTESRHGERSPQETGYRAGALLFDPQTESRHGERSPQEMGYRAGSDPQTESRHGERSPQEMGYRAGSDPQTESRRASAAPQSRHIPVPYIHVRGLPYGVSVDDIIQFFAPYIVSKITIGCGLNGRPNGKADIYFRDHRDAVSALSKDRMYIGRTSRDQLHIGRTNRT